MLAVTSSIANIRVGITPKHEVLALLQGPEVTCLSSPSGTPSGGLRLCPQVGGTHSGSLIEGLLAAAPCAPVLVLAPATPLGVPVAQGLGLVCSWARQGPPSSPPLLGGITGSSLSGVAPLLRCLVAARGTGFPPSSLGLALEPGSLASWAWGRSAGSSLLLRSSIRPPWASGLPLVQVFLPPWIGALRWAFSSGSGTSSLCLQVSVGPPLPHPQGGSCIPLRQWFLRRWHCPGPDLRGSNLLRGLEP